MSLAEMLWRENQDLARQTLAHPFVRGIGRGTLPGSNFAAYIGQDAFFLDAFARAYALAAARSPDRQGVHEFARLLNGVLEELELHATYAARWGIDVVAIEPMDATLAYTDFLLKTAAFGSVAETCAAMTPCMRLYAYLGQSLAADGVDDGNPYADWIHTYGAPEFDVLATTLERLLDRYADERQGRAPYRRAMQLELAFFEAHAGGVES
jgi:thiaminase (transcriptional activator TenA)